MKYTIVSTGLVSLAILASCAGNRNQGTYSSATAVAGTEAYASTDLPAECAGSLPGQENIMNDGGTIIMHCYCDQGGRRAEWYNVITPQLDPANYCHAPFNGLVFRANLEETAPPAPTTSSSTPHPAMPATSATPPPEQVPPDNSLKVSDLKYRCSSDGVAERTYKMAEERAGSRTTLAISQQCVGQGLTCLTDPAQQRDTSQPPCGCTDGLRLTVLSGQHRTWGCQSSTPPPSSATPTPPTVSN